MNEFKRLLSRHLENNTGKYVFLFVLFVTGVAVGIIFSQNVSAALTESLKSEIMVLIDGFEGGEIDEIKILQTSFVKNLRFFLLIFIGGLSVWLSPLICSVIVSYGFSIGFTFSYLSANFGTCGVTIAISSLLLQFLIAIPVYMILSVIAFNNGMGRRSPHHKDGNLGTYILIFGLVFLVSLIPVVADAFVIPGIIASICS